MVPIQVIQDLEKHSDPMDVGAGNCLASGQVKGSSSPRDGCFKCGGAHLQRDCSVHASPRKSNGRKGKQSNSRSKSAGKGKSMKGKGDGKSRGQFEGSKGAKGSRKDKTSKTSLSGLENPKAETSSVTLKSTQTYHSENSSTVNSWFDDGLGTSL